MPTETDAYLRVAALCKTYGHATALDSVDLTVAQGEFVTLLGASGSGKTTTLGCIAGFVHATSGEVELAGRSITKVPAYRRDIGVVFQNYALFPHMTVAENIAYPLRARKMPRPEIAERVARALDLVRLPKLGDRKPTELSGGQQQRVAIARAIVFNPRLLLLDEPMGALDKNLREQLRLEVMRLHRELDMTVVSVTHDQEEALTMSDRIAVYREGRIAQIGTAQALYSHPESRYVAEFIGESNTFVGVGARDGAAARVEVPGLGAFATPDFDAALADRPVALIVRPEMMTVARPVGDAPRAGTNRFTGRVIDSVYIGSSQKYLVDGGDGVQRQVRVPADGREVLGRGEPVEVSWSAASGSVLAAEDE
ncbi:ABC transporter ATP-binding protein [Agromyces silvae]|uniref:ABC transporter ATP-binding protein n=1 Tax=Agromyces silvae TaxID=3388266 RepID=UPI00280AEDAA|nr:ABC transporter ATP-binding protein [Agromyces protaetiae]